MIKDHANKAPPQSWPPSTPNIITFLSLKYIHKTETMKQTFHSYGLAVLLLVLFLIASQSTSARLLETKQGSEESVNFENPNSDTYEKLMGLEECENGDEECLKRRAVTEVHLDYIYTQHYKP